MRIHITTLIFVTSLFMFNRVLLAKNIDNTENKTKISIYVSSDSYSNILPIKQLVNDDWKQSPTSGSSDAFTQNEFGIRATWNNVIFDVAHRLDYFVSTEPDTAEAFYLERSDQSLTTQEEYVLDLQLLHQQSRGLRLGYQWHLDSIYASISVGYWDVISTRDSSLTGVVSGNDTNDISALAQLRELYSEKNFLKRTNDNDWDNDGYGVTVDVSLHWEINQQFNVNLDIKDLYSKYKFKNLGYSEGIIDSDGTFINSVGGQSYLPLYRGIESRKDYQFELPEQINAIGIYNAKTIDKKLSFLTRYKRQGNINFYYLGTQWQYTKSSKISFMLDLKNKAPEIEFQNDWVTFKFAIDKLNFEKANQLSFGLSFNKSF